MTAQQAQPTERPRLDPAEVARNRATRRRPQPTQWDYLHLRRLLEDLESFFRSLPPDVVDVLDVWCGARPYDDLLPDQTRCTGLDIDDMYGVADVVSTDYLPFEDESFDLVMSIEAFHYVPDPHAAAREISRVLRPGGIVLITVPHVFDYDPGTLERRFTEQELRRIFADWDEVRVKENGGRAVVWAAVTARLLQRYQRARERAEVSVRAPLFRAGYRTINLVGRALERLEARISDDPLTLPMNLMLTARKPGRPNA